MIQSYQANRIGSEDPMEPGVPQDFKDFYATSQVSLLCVVVNDKQT